MKLFEMATMSYKLHGLWLHANPGTMLLLASGIVMSESGQFSNLAGKTVCEMPNTNALKPWVEDAHRLHALLCRMGIHYNGGSFHEAAITLRCASAHVPKTEQQVMHFLIAGMEIRHQEVLQVLREETRATPQTSVS